MIKSSVSFLANHPLPMEVGTITVLPDGTAERRERTALHFSFDYTGTDFDGVIEPTPEGAHLRLDAMLAPLPYSAEGRERRRDLNAIIAASRTGLKYGRFALDSRRHIHLLSEFAIGSPVTPTALVSAATQMLIAATPWIALLRHHLGPATAPSGRARARSETVSAQGGPPRG
jgi:hypothetical protein